MERFESESLESKRRECVERIQEYQKRFDIWGHGVTSREIAEIVMIEGLRTEWKALHDIAHKLPDDPGVIAHKLSGWDYESRKFILLVPVPKGFVSSDVGGTPEREKSIRSSNEHVFVRSESRNVIPPNKIIGFIDTNTYEFVENVKFES